MNNNGKVIEMQNEKAHYYDEPHRSEYPVSISLRIIEGGHNVLINVKDENDRNAVDRLENLSKEIYATFLADHVPHPEADGRGNWPGKEIAEELWDVNISSTRDPDKYYAQFFIKRDDGQRSEYPICKRTLSLDEWVEFFQGFNFTIPNNGENRVVALDARRIQVGGYFSPARRTKIISVVSDRRPPASRTESGKEGYYYIDPGRLELI